MERPAFLYVFCSFVLLLFVHVTPGKSFTDEEINRQLRVLNKPAVKTIKTQYGDIFDCVNIHEQPAFDHPLLKHHKLKMRPTLGIGKEAQAEYEHSDAQIRKIGMNGTGCPFGTVPIRRTHKEELVYSQQLLKQHEVPENESKVSDPPNGYTFYHMSLGQSKRWFYGTKARLNIWSLSLERYFASSIAAYVGNLPDTLEAGWMVNPYLYGDSQSRLYVKWTGSPGTGCENMLCPGFVQVHTSVPLGVTFDHMSVKDGPQYEIHIQIMKDVAGDGDWWLFVGDAFVGYWPKEIFPKLGNYSTQIGWGGTTRVPDGANYAPPMGSGETADNNFRKACYIRRVQFMSYNGTFYDPDWFPLGHIKRRPQRNCYTLKDQGYNTNDEWRRHIYVGGPGCSLSIRRDVKAATMEHDLHY